MFKIAIIGCGQIGSRHLQGLLKIGFPILIDVVDSSEESIKLAKNRSAEIDSIFNSDNVRYFTSITQMEDDMDLCIIATSAKIRLKVLKQLLILKKVKYLVLEKVLFQSLDEYVIAQKLFDYYKVKCWVNCPMPMYEVYKNIKSKIGHNEVITYRVIGGEWGIACNAIHFIDHMAFLSNQKNFLYDHSGITSITESKRKGFVEFAGTLIGRQPNGSEIFLHSRAGSNLPMKTTILTNNYYWEINEILGTLAESSKADNWQENLHSIKIPYQSELSNKFVTQILLEGRCDLTTYQNSMKLHSDMIISLLDCYNSLTSQNEKFCPIT